MRQCRAFLSNSFNPINLIKNRKSSCVNFYFNNESIVKTGFMYFSPKHGKHNYGQSNVEQKVRFKKFA